MAHLGDDHDYLLKFVVIGDKNVGKTCLVLRFTDDSFVDTHKVTIGVDVKVRTLEIDGVKAKLQLWDTAGEERFRSISSQYYRGAEGIAIVYDVTNELSFKNIEKWVLEANTKSEMCQKVLIANKCDKIAERVIDSLRGATLAQSLNMDYIETSAKQCKNVDEAFLLMTKNVLGIKDNNLNRSVRHETVNNNDTIKIGHNTSSVTDTGVCGSC